MTAKRSKEPEVVMRHVSQLRPHLKNPRTHPQKQIDGLGAAFKEFGMIQFPVIDEKGTILAGEGRWLAASQSGPEQLPCIVVRGWSEAKKLAFVLSDNRWAMLGGFDQEKLQIAIRELTAVEFDLRSVGYEMKSLDDVALDTSPQLDQLSYAVIVRCKSEEQQTKLLARFQKEGLKCEALIS